MNPIRPLTHRRRTPPRPTSSPPRPTPQGRPQELTSSLVPLPYGGRGQLKSTDDHHTNMTSTPPRDDVTGRGCHNPYNHPCPTCGANPGDTCTSTTSGPLGPFAVHWTRADAAGMG